MRKVLLTTSDIFTYHEKGKTKHPRGGVELKYTSEQLEFWSTGVLERVLEAGHQVIVATTRSRSELGNHDQWWLALVGEDNVFFASDNESLPHNRRYSQGWMQAFEVLGIPWPMDGDEPEHWTAAQSLLKPHGILTTYDFGG